MAGHIHWEKNIGRRFQLRDLQVFFTVADRGSMAKAAADLGVTQPSVSGVISGLETSLGARLFERSPRGVELTRVRTSFAGTGSRRLRRIASGYPRCRVTE